MHALLKGTPQNIRGNLHDLSCGNVSGALGPRHVEFLKGHAEEADGRHVEAQRGQQKQQRPAEARLTGIRLTDMFRAPRSTLQRPISMVAWSRDVYTYIC